MGWRRAHGRGTRRTDFLEYISRHLDRAQGARLNASDANAAGAKPYRLRVIHAPGFLDKFNRGAPQLFYLHADLQTIIEFRWRMVIDGRIFYYKDAAGFS
jgi:hypothetical protein